VLIKNRFKMKIDAATAESRTTNPVVTDRSIVDAPRSLVPHDSRVDIPSLRHQGPVFQRPASRRQQFEFYAGEQHDARPVIINNHVVNNNYYNHHPPTTKEGTFFSPWTMAFVLVSCLTALLCAISYFGFELRPKECFDCVWSTLMKALRYVDWNLVREYVWVVLGAFKSVPNSASKLK